MKNSASIRTCSDCGKPFIILPNQRQRYFEYCPICHKAWQEKQQRQRDEAAAAEWKKAREKETAEFNEKFGLLETVELSKVPADLKSLYIIGNGFDLMHGVKSSYYDFRNSIGKRNALIGALETAFTPDDIWADFEESLGHINIDSIGSRAMADMWLDTFGFFSDKEESASTFFMATEAAANPIATVANDLQPALRRWVNKLKVRTEDRPLSDLIDPAAKALCFNYTEFVEGLYGVRDVCYIHGCRKDKHGKLIIGHRSDVEIPPLRESHKEPRTHKQAVIDAAQNNALGLIASCDKALTKDSQKIIANHCEFFNSLSGISQIVVVGHSVSRVDWPYFGEVKKNAPNVRWFFGVHGLRDLENVLHLTEEMHLENYCMFRTDKIKTAQEAEPAHGAKKNPSHEKTFKDGDKSVTIDGKNLCIERTGYSPLEIILPSMADRVAFLDEHLILRLDDIDKHLLLFLFADGVCKFIAPLKAPKNQALLNRRLRHVYATESEITFVYNNRIRAFDLSTGKVTCTRAERGAKDHKFDGVDIIEDLTGKPR